MANVKKANKEIPCVPGMQMNHGFSKVYHDTITKIVYDCGFTSGIVYIVLLRHYNQQSKQCFPSIATIMAESSASRNTLEKCLNLLYENHYILIDSGGKNKTNHYYFPQEDFFDPSAFEKVPEKRIGSYLKKTRPKKNSNITSRPKEEVETDILKAKEKEEKINSETSDNPLSRNPGEKNIEAEVKDDGLYGTWYTGYEPLDRPDRDEDDVLNGSIQGSFINQTARRRIFKEQKEAPKKRRSYKPTFEDDED